MALSTPTQFKKLLFILKNWLDLFFRKGLKGDFSHRTKSQNNFSHTILRGIVLSMLLLYTPLCFSQSLDSLALIDTFEKYELLDNASLGKYLDLLKENERDVNIQNRITFLTKGAETATSLKNDSLYVGFYLELVGLYAAELRDTKTARTLIDVMADKVASINPNSYYIASYYGYTGIVYYLEGDYVNALDNYTKGYHRVKKKYPQKARGSLYNIISIYSSLGDSKNTIKYAKEALSLNEYLSERDANLNTAASNCRLATHYRMGDYPDSASFFLKKALAAIDKVDNPQSSFNDIQTYCEIYLQALIHSIEEGDETKVDALLQKIALCKGQAEPLYSITMIKYYLMKEDFEKAALLLADTSIIDDTPSVRKEFLRHQSYYEEKTGNYKKALDLYKKLTDLVLEMRKDRNSRYASFASAQFDDTKQKEEIKRLQIIKDYEKSKSKLYLIILVILITLLIGALFVFYKINEKKAIIEKQANELKQIDAIKSRLFTNLSHELRTPLTLIVNPIDRILYKVSLDKLDREQLQLAKKSSYQLLAISNQIMDLNKNEFGQLKLNLVRFDWSTFMDSLLPLYEIQAKSNKLSFNHIEDNLENIAIQTDLGKLSVVLSNLFQNAIKFSSPNGMLTFCQKDKGAQLFFSITDTGRGIAKEDLPHVFERYYQSKTNVEAEGGFGIGLSVCKEYIELLEGTIAIESGIGKGTTVSVQIPKIISTTETVDFHTFENTPLLPLSVSPNEAIEEKEALPDDSPQLLIVENNTEIREFYQTILQDDYELVFAVNGIDALETLETIKPSLVITDWMMPVMNGMELVKKMRDMEEFYNLPILMVTARSLPTDQLKAFKKGVDDYLLKPFDVDLLKFRIEHLLDSSNERLENADLTGDIEKANLLSIANQTEEDLQWITNFEEVIYKHIGDFDLTVEGVSPEVQTSKTQINRNVKRITGMTPKQFINEIRFWEARKLIEQEDEISVKSVAYSVGFKSVKNFSRNFKKRFGVYPSELL